MKLLKLYGLALLTLFSAFAYANAQNGSIKVGPVSGSVTFVNGDTGASSAATQDAILSAPITVITDGDGSVLLFLSNGAILDIKPGSRIEINLFTQSPFEIADPFQATGVEPSDSQVSIRVVSGELAAKVPTLAQGSTFLINTPTSDIIAKDIVVVVGFNPTTAETQVSNVGGNGGVSYESSTPGSTPSDVPSGQTLTAPGQVDPSTGAASTSGQPSVAPASPETVNAGNQVSNPPVTPPANPALPTTPPAPDTTTPELDIPDLINPTSTEPN